MKCRNTCQWLVIGCTKLCGKSCLGDDCKLHLPRLRRGSGTQPCMECGKGVKIDSSYVWTAVTIKLGCLPGKGVIGLLWSSLTSGDHRNFHLEVFHQLPILIWNCGIIMLGCVPGKGVTGLLWSGVNVWRPSKFYLDVFQLGCVPGKGVIGLLWSSLNVWWPSNFHLEVFPLLPIPIWNCGIIKLRYMPGK